MPINPNTHHRRSIRIPNYDYTQPGAYYITVTSFDRRKIFGQIMEGKVILSEIGSIVLSEWTRIEKRFKKISLGSFVIMPNHIHGIIIINGRDTGDFVLNSNIQNLPRVPTGERFGAPVSGSIPTILRSFKSSTTQRCHTEFTKRVPRIWQKGYYEHVIRNSEDMDRISAYIEANPSNWEKDKLTDRFDY